MAPSNSQTSKKVHPIFDTTQIPPDELRKSERVLQSTFLFIFIISIVGAILFANESWGLLSFKLDLADNWSDIFTKYLFIIIAIERAAAVYIGLDRTKAKRAWDRRIKRVRELLERKRVEISLADLVQFHDREKHIMDEFKGQKGFLGVNPPGDGKNTSGKYDKELHKEEYLAYLTVTKSVYEFKRTKYEEITHQMTTRLVFVGGMIIAVIGLSIFNDIFDASSLEDQANGYWWQMAAYRLADIVVTGGLLGGGSKSFNIFLETLNQQFNRIKDPKGEN